MNRDTFTAALAAWVIVLWSFTLPAAEPPAQVTVPGFTRAEAAAANNIGLVGPTKADTGDEITIRLTGTPPLDLTQPLVDQLDWLMGEARMYCYMAAPGKKLAPLDVRGELVFSSAGATMQPLLRIVCDTPGECRVLVDWNSGQDQLAEHVFVVGGQPDPQPDPDPEPDPDPNPPLPPLSQLRATIMIEADSQRQDDQTTPDDEGVFRYQHLAAVTKYLKGLGMHCEQVDNDNPETWAGYLAEKQRLAPSSDLPVVVLTALRDDGEDDKTAAVVPFGVNELATIASLKELGIK